MKSLLMTLLPIWLVVVVFAGCTGGPPEEAVDFSAWAVTPVEKVADGFRFTEGPVWHKDGYLLFSDIPANRIYKWTPGKAVEVYRPDSGKSNGLTIDGQGRLVACEHWNRRISRTEMEGAIMAVCGLYSGKRFNSPNDLAIRSDGMIFFTDPTYGLEGRDKEQSCNGLYRIKPGMEAVLLARDFNMPNGLALSPDEDRLYVAGMRDRLVSLVDLVVRVSKKGVTGTDINESLKEASETTLKGILGYSQLPLVSTDFNGCPLSSIVDAQTTDVIGDMVKVLSWYDNETGYSNRMVDLAAMIGNQL